MKFPEIRTNRILLNEISTEDTDAIYQLYTDADVLTYYDLECLKNHSEATTIVEEFTRRFYEFTGIRWAIRKNNSPDLLGTCGFNSWNKNMRNAIIGYDLLPSHWGHGYAREAIAAIVDIAFTGKLPCGTIHRIQAETVPGNLRSEQLLRKLGFKEEGLRRQAGFWKNNYHDLKCFGLLHSEWVQS